MTKDEALDLALEALDIVKIHFTQNRHVNEAITAIKQARALDKKAENARELGLDYEPVGLIDRLKNPEQHYEFTDPKKANAVLMSLCQEAADALAAPTVQEPVAYLCENAVGHKYFRWKKPSSTYKPIALYATPPTAQPAVPDALFRHAPEHPQYIEGWNDCRAEMMKGMKP
jgi:hypothetical protein